MSTTLTKSSLTNWKLSMTTALWCTMEGKSCCRLVKNICPLWILQNIWGKGLWHLQVVTIVPLEWVWLLECVCFCVVSGLPSPRKDSHPSSLFLTVTCLLGELRKWIQMILGVLTDSTVVCFKSFISPINSFKIQFWNLCHRLPW